MPSLISFFSVLAFSLMRSFISLIRFISTHLFILCVYCERYCFLGFFFWCVFNLAYGKDIHFCAFIFCPDTLLYLFTNSRFYVVIFRVVYIKKSYHIQKEVLIFPFQFLSCFVPFSCHITLAKISSTVLNRGEQSGQHCQVSNGGMLRFFFIQYKLLTLDRWWESEDHCILRVCPLLYFQCFSGSLCIHTYMESIHSSLWVSRKENGYELGMEQFKREMGRVIEVSEG